MSSNGKQPAREYERHPVPIGLGLDLGFAKGRGADHGQRVEREAYNEDGAESPAGSRGGAPGGGQETKPPESKSFSSIFIRKRGQHFSI